MDELRVLSLEPKWHRIHRVKSGCKVDDMVRVSEEDFGAVTRTRDVKVIARMHFPFTALCPSASDPRVR